MQADDDGLTVLNLARDLPAIVRNGGAVQDIATGKVLAQRTLPTAATRAALELADAKGFASVAMPGMGTGVGGVAHADAAAMMVKEIRALVPRALQTVVLVDVDPAMVQAWRDALKEIK